ncbi:hypothetical protein MHM88_14170 [Epibacterium sp. MM17-32]|uniref:hypothetical protein n=1 Tax=Epibacterium sp. MM17-32 TaxID=2917734 RepID=UPI001EF4ECC5|nr:hypothetical protein [Epibacterium sp. MM17-32]MCG7628953.1 hypothetical protein [Epibacterium sp. MM17-32]
MQLQRKIPLHGKGGPLEAMSLWADMAALNPKGFRDLSVKKNRARGKSANPKKIGLNGRFLSRPEQLNLQLKAA